VGYVDGRVCFRRADLLDLLFNLLRRSPDITVGAIRIQPYHEFARNLPVPTNLNLIHLKPLRGTGLVVFSPSLVFIAVDNLFGGDGRFPTKVEGREFTHTEQRVINRMLKLALEGYSDAWKAINPLEVEYVRSEMQVKFTNITTSPNDIVVNTPFHVEILVNFTCISERTYSTSSGLIAFQAS
ncbi:hypothetical protein ACUOA8_30540, partial [Escherichia sp. SS-MK2]